MQSMLNAAPFGRWTGCDWTTVATQAHLDLCGLRNSQLPQPSVVADQISQVVRRLSKAGRIDPSDLSRRALFLVSGELGGLLSRLVSGIADAEFAPTTLPDLVHDALTALGQAGEYLRAVESDAVCAEKWAAEALAALEHGRVRVAEDLLAAVVTLESSYEPGMPVWGPWVAGVRRNLTNSQKHSDTVISGIRLVSA